MLQQKYNGFKGSSKWAASINFRHIFGFVWQQRIKSNKRHMALSSTQYSHLTWFPVQNEQYGKRSHCDRGADCQGGGRQGRGGPALPPWSCWLWAGGTSVGFLGRIDVFGGHCHVFSVRWRCQRVERKHNNSRGFYLDQYWGCQWTKNVVARSISTLRECLKGRAMSVTNPDQVSCGMSSNQAISLYMYTKSIISE